MYRRPGRKFWYCAIDGRKHISLGTEDQQTAAVEFAKRVDSFRLQRIAPTDVRIEKIFKETVKRAEIDSAPKTVYELNLKLADVLEWLLWRDIVAPRAITKQLIEQYKRDRKAGDAKRSPWTNRSVNRYLDAWKRAHKIAVEKGSAIPESLTWFVHLKEPRPVPHDRGLTKKEIAKILGATENTGYRALFRLLIGSGLRYDEACHLDKKDIGARWITVTPKEDWNPKNHRFRKIPITAETKAAALTFVTARNDGLSVDQKTAWRALTDACKRAKVRHASAHDFRRAWASHLLLAGESLQNISRWLGHGDLLTTQRYLRIVEERDPPRGRLPF